MPSGVRRASAGFVGSEREVGGGSVPRVACGTRTCPSKQAPAVGCVARRPGSARTATPKSAAARDGMVAPARLPALAWITCDRGREF